MIFYYFTCFTSPSNVSTKQYQNLWFRQHSRVLDRYYNRFVLENATYYVLHYIESGEKKNYTNPYQAGIGPNHLLLCDLLCF